MGKQPGERERKREINEVRNHFVQESQWPQLHWFTLFISVFLCVWILFNFITDKHA